MSTALRVLVVTYDVVGPKMAGPGIRAWEFARVLGQEFPTTLAAPPPLPEKAPGFTLAQFPTDETGYATLAGLIREHDIIVAQILPIQYLPGDILADKYFVVDLYCPWLIENLEHYRVDGAEDTDWLLHNIETMSNLFSAGDFFVCAGEIQRAYWLGALSFFGRLTEAVYAENIEGRALIDVVPFGLAAEPPQRTGPAMKGVIPGIAQEDFVALWGGGVWNWLDPLTLIRATARLRDAGYPIRSVFLGTQRPSASAEATMRPTMVDTARCLSAELGLTGSHVFFLEGWVPYTERANYLLDADVGISLHQRTLETRFAFRTRVLDYLWAGLVPIVNDGDTVADLVRTHAIGNVVPIGEDAALADAIAAMIDHPEKRQAFAARCQTLAQSYTWETVARPMVEFCRDPRKPAGETRAVSVALQREMQRIRQVAYETSQYAGQLEQHIADTTRYMQELEERVAHPSFRTFLAAQIRKTPLHPLLAWKEGRSRRTAADRA